MKKKLLFFIFLSGVLSVIGGIVFNPSFAATYLSSDGILHPATVHRIHFLQLYAMTLGGLVILGSAIAYSISYNKVYGKILFLPFLAVALLLVYNAMNKTYPENILLKPSELIKIGSVLLGKELILSDYQPKSMLVVENHQVERAKYPVINIHAHFTAWIEKLNEEQIIKIMDNCGVEKIVDLDVAANVFKDKIENYKNNYAGRLIAFYHIWFPDGTVPDTFFSEEVARLEEAVKMGAKGLKIWMNLGLKARDSSGKLIPVDDPRLDPVWTKAGELGIPVLIHVNDPSAFFISVDRYNERFEELSAFPQWSFYGPEFPSKQTVLGQFENVIKKHPKTIFIGAHMAMMGENLNYLGSLLDKYPNLYVELSAQVHELGRQPYTARRFFIKYQDRILFGTDGNPREDHYRAYFRFLETSDEYFDYPFSDVHNFGRWKIYGLYLPDEVLKKIYYKNAEKLIL